jgi:hypothetical protein
MTGDARDWLPTSALNGEGVRRCLADAVDRWAGKWFARLAVTMSRPDLRSGAAPEQPQSWQRYGSAVAMAASSSDLTRIAGFALAASPERLVLSEVDRGIIGRFTTAVLADLAAQLEQALGADAGEECPAVPVEDPFGGGGGLLFDLSEGYKRPLLRCAIPLAPLVGFRRSIIPASAARRAPIAPISRAVARTRLRVEASLGEAILPLGELAGLAVGDVLILDRAIEGGIGLTAGPHRSGIARGHFAASEGPISLNLSPELESNIR